jgi:hypothetical protein
MYHSQLAGAHISLLDRRELHWAGPVEALDATSVHNSDSHESDWLRHYQQKLFFVFFGQIVAPHNLRGRRHLVQTNRLPIRSGVPAPVG